MSELNPLNGGKKSKILEERRLREEREQQRIRKQERERRNKKALTAATVRAVITGKPLLSTITIQV